MNATSNQITDYLNNFSPNRIPDVRKWVMIADGVYIVQAVGTNVRSFSATFNEWLDENKFRNVSMQVINSEKRVYAVQLIDIFDNDDDDFDAEDDDMEASEYE